MNTRKLAAALAALLLTNVLLAAFAAAKDFADVPDGHWAREDIRYVTERGLFLVHDTVGACGERAPAFLVEIRARDELPAYLLLHEPLEGGHEIVYLCPGQ